MKFIDKLIGILSWRISQIGQFAIVAVMVLIAGNVIIRAIWTPVPGTVEMTEILGAIIAGMGVAYTQHMKSHIFVSVLVNRFPLRVQGIIDACTMLLAMFITSILARRIVEYGLRMMDRGYSTGHLDISIHPFIILVGIGFIMLALVLLKDFLKALTMAIKGSEL